MLDARRMQTNLRVPVDGIIGAGTLTALFARMGAAPAIAAEPSVHRMASLWMRDLSAWLRQAMETASRRKSAVDPDRSRATSTGIKSMPRSLRDARPPRSRGLRPVRWPLLDRRKKVSSASTTPVSSDALTACAKPGW